MLIVKEEFKLHSLIRNTVARLLFLNGLFVIIGYALANLTAAATVGIVSNFKNIFLFISFVHLLANDKVINPRNIFDSGFVPILFGFLIIYVSIGSGADSKAFDKTLTFFVPLIYIYLSLSYLIANFGIQLLLKGLHWSLLVIYSIPLIIYILSGGKITDTNIYGSGGTDQAFASNNYGWSSTIYILSYLFVWKDIKLKKFIKVLFSVLLIVAIILLFTSANRASWLSMSIAMIPFFISYKAIKIKYKIAAILVILGFVSVLLANPNSSINFALSKTQVQERVGEARFETAQIMLNHFNNDKSFWITGYGMFNFKLLRGNTKLSSYHNSYWEVLFGVGIPLFLVFLSFMVFRPLVRFIKYYSKFTFLFPPFLILPFFESNLTGGQFLFFPWFTFMLLLNAKVRLWNKETLKVRIKKPDILNAYPIINETNNSVL